MSAPDLTKKVIGYRSWTLVDGELRPQNQHFGAWSVGVNKARCANHHGRDYLYRLAHGGHDAPEHDCGCGLYAYHEPEKASFGEGWVPGAITAWGRMEVHPDGFRAQFAQPVAFAYDDSVTLGWHRKVGDFAREHGIKYIPLEELEEFALAFGEPVPESLRPEPEDLFGSSHMMRLSGMLSTFPSPSYHWGAGQISFGAYSEDAPKPSNALLPKPGEFAERVLKLPSKENA